MGCQEPLYQIEALNSLLDLGALAQAVRDQPCAKLSLSPLDLRTDCASESNLRRHVESLYNIFQGFMVEMATFSRVLLQQQLSSEHQDGPF